MTSRNEELFTRAQRTIPGGVNSPVRAFRSVGGTPRFLKKASGARVWDADGKEYLDYVGSWGPAILGHADPVVVEAVRAAALDGLSSQRPGMAWQCSAPPRWPLPRRWVRVATPNQTHEVGSWWVAAVASASRSSTGAHEVVRAPLVRLRVKRVSQPVSAWP